MAEPVDVPVVLPVQVPDVAPEENPPAVAAAQHDDEPQVQPQALPQAQPAEIGEQLRLLKEEVQALRANRSPQDGVDAALQFVRQLASSPVTLRDPTMISAALQTLADQARCASHPKSAEFEAILRQTRPLLYRPEYGDVIIRLLGTKEETAVAATIAKMTKNLTSNRQPPAHPYRRQFRGRGSGWRFGRDRTGANRATLLCFHCGRPGHFQRHCPDNNSTA